MAPDGKMAEAGRWESRSGSLLFTPVGVYGASSHTHKAPSFTAFLSAKCTAPLGSRDAQSRAGIAPPRLAPIRLF